METVTLEVNKDKEDMQQKITKVEKTLLQKKGPEAKETDAKPKVVSKTKVGVVKPQGKQEISDKKKTVSSGSSAGQILLKHDRRKEEEARKGKTTILQKTDSKLVKEGTAIKTYAKSDHLKDEPQSNITQGMKKKNSTIKIVTVFSKVTGQTNKTRTGKETLDHSTVTEKNITQSGLKSIKLDNKNEHSTNNRKISAGNSGKKNVLLKQVTNSTILVSSDKTKILQNETTTHSSRISTRKTGGLGTVKVVNISSYAFTVTWLAPKGMFQNFTVIRREPRTHGDEHEHVGFEEEGLERDKMSSAGNATEVYSESVNATEAAAGSRDKAEARRISMVVPGSVRSVEFSNLRTNTRYVLYVYGTTANRRSNVHRVTAATGYCSSNMFMCVSNTITQGSSQKLLVFCWQVLSHQHRWFSAM